MEHFHVSRTFLKQRAEREHSNLRPAGRDGRFLEHQIRLPVIGLIFENFLDHLHRALRILLHFALRFHDRDGRGRDVEEGLLRRLVLGDFRPPQQLASGQKFRLLPQNSLDEGNGVAKIPQFDRGHGFQPMTALRFAQFLFCLNRHFFASVYIIDFVKASAQMLAIVGPFAWPTMGASHALSADSPSCLSSRLAQTRRDLPFALDVTLPSLGYRSRCR